MLLRLQRNLFPSWRNLQRQRPHNRTRRPRLRQRQPSLRPRLLRRLKVRLRSVLRRMASRYVRRISLARVASTVDPRCSALDRANNLPVNSPAPCVPPRLVNHVPAVSRSALCLPEIAARSRQAIVDPYPPATAVLFHPAIVPADLAPASPCDRKVGPAAKADRSVLALAVVQADLVVRKIVLTASVPAQSRPALVPARVLLAALACFPLHLRIVCRPRPSLASRFTRANRRSASALSPTSAKWKVSASFIRRASVRVPVIAPPR